MSLSVSFKEKLVIWLHWVLAGHSGSSRLAGYFLATHRLRSCGSGAELLLGMWLNSDQDLTCVPAL